MAAPGEMHGGSGDGPPDVAYPRDSIEFNRIVNLSDAVVAIALTILVLALEVPEATGDESTADIGAIFDHLGAPIFAFALSFVIIAFSWYGHHQFVARLRGLNRAMVVWNFAYLFFLVLVPFASDLVGNYGSNPSALAVYAGLMAAVYAVELPGQLLARSADLDVERLTGAQFRARMIMVVVPPAAFLLSIPIVLASSGSAAFLWILIWPMMVLGGRYQARVDAEAARAGEA